MTSKLNQDSIPVDFVDGRNFFMDCNIFISYLEPLEADGKRPEKHGKCDNGNEEDGRINNENNTSNCPRLRKMFKQ